jgi:hypothetical protein
VTSCRVSLDIGRGPKHICDMRDAAVVRLALGFAVAALVGPSAAQEEPAKRADTVVTGHWGGQHVVLDATENGGTIEYDCAHGRIMEPLRVDEDGSFRARGTHTREHGGPIRKDERPAERAATYAGKVTGAQMHLTVTLADPDETLGTFDLERDARGRLVKCR